jgi:glycosyltransferase involved in cell wall biosynthesis
MIWQIITGEYPPQPGGVSDYTRVVACGLVAAGDEVHVWAPRCSASELADAGVVVHRLAGRFGVRTLARLDARLVRAGGGSILIQYEPQALGWKGMNLPFCLWLARGRREMTLVMFHEVMFPLERGRPLKDNLRGVVNRSMASLAARAATRIFVATPYWVEVLRARVGISARADWLPIPSAIPVVHDEAATLAIRRRLAPAGGMIVGHFSTYPEATRRMLASVIPQVLAADPRLTILLLGTSGAEFRATLGTLSSELSARTHATGTLAADNLSSHLSACDLMVQPYPDGASARRSSLIAALAHGRPVLTTIGPATDSCWSDSGAVALVSHDAAAVARGIEDLLADPTRRSCYGARAAALHRTRFAPERTIEALRAAACASQ